MTLMLSDSSALALSISCWKCCLGDDRPGRPARRRLTKPICYLEGKHPSRRIVEAREDYCGSGTSLSMQDILQCGVAECAWKIIGDHASKEPSMVRACSLGGQEYCPGTATNSRVLGRDLPSTSCPYVGDGATCLCYSNSDLLTAGEHEVTRHGDVAALPGRSRQGRNVSHPPVLPRTGTQALEEGAFGYGVRPTPSSACQMLRGLSIPSSRACPCHSSVASTPLPPAHYGTALTNPEVPHIGTHDRRRSFYSPWCESFNHGSEIPEVCTADSLRRPLVAAGYASPDDGVPARGSI